MPSAFISWSERRIWLCLTAKPDCPCQTVYTASSGHQECGEHVRGRLCIGSFQQYVLSRFIVLRYMAEISQFVDRDL